MRPLRCVMLAAVSVIMLAASGCMQWTSRNLSVPELLESQHFDVLRVTRSDSSVMLVHAPQVRGAALVGVRETPTAGVERVEVPLPEIAGVEVFRISGPRTDGLIVGLAGVALGLGLLARGITEAEN